jgi:hypothetical protein
LKHYQALSDIRPQFDIPSEIHEALEDVSGRREKLFLQAEPRASEHAVTGDETQIVIKEAGSSKFPTSFQLTKFGRHPMVLRK